MSDAAFIGSVPLPKAEKAAIELPAPQPFAAPVFIHDCVTPLAGETLLSLLMKRMAQDDQP